LCCQFVFRLEKVEVEVIVLPLFFIYFVKCLLLRIITYVVPDTYY